MPKTKEVPPPLNEVDANKPCGKLHVQAHSCTTIRATRRKIAHLPRPTFLPKPPPHEHASCHVLALPTRCPCFPTRSRLLRGVVLWTRTATTYKGKQHKLSQHANYFQSPDTTLSFLLLCVAPLLVDQSCAPKLSPHHARLSDV